MLSFFWSPLPVLRLTDPFCKRQPKGKHIYKVIGHIYGQILIQTSSHFSLNTSQRCGGQCGWAVNMDSVGIWGMMQKDLAQWFSTPLHASWIKHGCQFAGLSVCQSSFINSMANSEISFFRLSHGLLENICLNPGRARLGATYSHEGSSVWVSGIKPDWVFPSDRWYPRVLQTALSLTKKHVQKETNEKWLMQLYKSEKQRTLFYI